MVLGVLEILISALPSRFTNLCCGNPNAADNGHGKPDDRSEKDLSDQYDYLD